MKNKRIIAALYFLIVTVFFIPVYSASVKNKKKESRKQRTENVITPEESARMIAEADDFIDEISDGRQDRQADAISHSIEGSTAELLILRKEKEQMPETRSDVEIRNIPASPETGGVSLTLYNSKEQAKGSLPLFIFLHDGGWSLGGSAGESSFCQALAASGTVRVLTVSYSLSPENQYPSALNECVKVVEYVLAHVEEFGTTQDSISIGGAGSGGNLALACALAMGREKTKLRSIVLFYPIVKAWVEKTESWKKWNRGYGLDSRLIEAYIKAYIGKGDASESLISPASASDAQLADLPPVILICGERDILVDQSSEFVERIKRLNGKADMIIFPGVVHHFIGAKGQPTAFNKSVDITEVFLKKK